MHKKKIYFLISHPIQYFSPLFKKLAEDESLDFMVLYCSDENVKGHFDKQFGVTFAWDIPVLNGYNYNFLKNHSWKPSIYNGFFGLINFSLIKILKGNKDTILIIHGWNRFTMILGLIIAKLRGIKVYLRAENPFKQEIKKKKINILIKKIFLGQLIFPLFDKILYIGHQNKEFYRFYGVPEKKLIFTPYCIDNDRFLSYYKLNFQNKENLKVKLGLPLDHIIILFAGKFISKKNPFDLLKAFEELNLGNVTLVMVGDGELRKELESYVNTKEIRNIVFTGFKNQTEIPEYYLISDIFVLPSGIGETWGLVINEAMNFGLPIISSDLVGCSNDLVLHGKNGFIFQEGNINQLSRYLKILVLNDDFRQEAGKLSADIISDYSYDKVIEGIVK
ncbi:MAG: glycosyltransferase family 4 protein [Cytophagaceae bacterium]